MSTGSSRWISAAHLQDFEPLGAQLLEHGGKSIALFKMGNEIYAMDNACPHQGGPLVEGFVKDNRVTCPWHAWDFDVKTGACLTVPSYKQKTYPVKIENEKVFILLES